MSGRLFFQVGVIVTDLHSAMDELSRAVGMTWTEPADRRLGDDDLRIAFSREGPPYVELIESEAGGGWDSSSGPHLDHLAFWSPDLEQDRGRLRRGRPSLDGRALSGLWMYHGTQHAGMRIEHIDESLRQQFRQRVGDERVVPRSVLDAYFAAINEHRYDDVAALFSDTAEFVAPGPSVMRARTDLAVYLEHALQLYPQHAQTTTRLIEAGNTIAVELRFSGILASGTSVEFDAVNIFDLDPSGQIAKLSAWYDFHELRRVLRELTSI